MRLLTLALAIGLTTACASQPVAPTAPASAAAVAPAKPAAPAAANATGDATNKTKAPSGYTTKMRNGETVYCKKVARIGSNLTTETCMTAAEAEQLARQAELDRVLLRKNQTICGTAGCGGT